MSLRLRAAIERVYNAFKDVPRPVAVEGCPCCINEKGISVLLLKDLRDLSADDLTHYAQSVFLTVGSTEDFFYFIPRILEVLALEPNWWPDPEVVAAALHTSGFHDWPAARFKAVSEYFDAMLSEFLNKDNSGWEIDSWICALGRLRVDLKPFLKQIAVNRARLIEFYEVNSNQLIEGRLCNAFWDEAPQECKVVVDWFRSTETKKAIELAYGPAESAGDESRTFPESL